MWQFDESPHWNQPLLPLLILRVICHHHHVPVSKVMASNVHSRLKTSPFVIQHIWFWSATFANFISLPFIFLWLFLLLSGVLKSILDRGRKLATLESTYADSGRTCKHHQCMCHLFATRDCIRFAYIRGHLELCYRWLRPTIFDWTRDILCHPLTFWYITPPHRFHNQLSLRK